VLALTVVLIRLIGLYYLAGWAINLSTVMAILQADAGQAAIMQYGVWSVLVPGVMALLIILLAESIAALISPKKRDNDVAERKLTQHGFMRVGVVLIALWLIVNDLQRLIQIWLIMETRPFQQSDIPQLVGPVIGVAMIFWARFAPRLLPKDLQKKSGADDPVGGV
jgi:hypothetical protein